MKKRLVALLLAGCMALGLAACGGGGSNNTEGGDEQVTLRFASWALGTEEENNIQRQMIAAFEKKYPNIKIEIAEEITGNWNEALATAATGGTLPDVSLIAELPTAVANGWALDVSQYANEDADWDKVPADLVESGEYNDKLYGIPTAMHMAGVFINTDYFDEANVDYLEYGYEWEDFVNVTKKLHKPAEGKVALKYVNDFVNFIPYVWDADQGWYTYDGAKLSLDSEAFINAVKETNSLLGYSWAALSEDQKAQSVGADKGDYDAWKQGYTAMWYGATYECEGYNRDLSYNVQYIALPGGKSAIIPDYCFISATTEHPEEAWEFVKFMYWGPEGINAKMDIDEADDAVSWTELPLSADEAVLERYFKDFPIAGVEEAYRGLTTNGSIVEAYKFAPGYVKARWEGDTGITVQGADATLTIGALIDKCIAGELSIDDYAKQLNEKANSFIEETRDKIDQKTK